MRASIFTYLLPLLKLLGLSLTAFFAVAEHFREKGKSPEIEKRHRRWSISAILLSLAVAASAELIDAVSKKQEAVNAAKSAAESAAQTRQIVNDLDRSLHPLFPIKITPAFRVELHHPAVASYRDRLVKAFPASEDDLSPELAPGTPLFPDHNREPAAYALLTAAPQMRVFVLRNPGDPPLPFEKENPDLSFMLKKTAATPPLAAGQKPGARAKIDSYGFSKEGIVSIRFPTETINASDCYSKGNIISPSDLLGARMTIEVSAAIEIPVAIAIPDQGVKDTADVSRLYESFGLGWVSIELPGIQEFQLRQQDFERVTYRGRMLFIYTFPKTKEELSKMFLP